MDFPIIFDVAIGLVVIYFMSSLVLSFLIEYVIVRRNWRGDFLYNQLKNMFYSDKGGLYNIIENVYRHPLIAKMQQYPYRRPEEINSNTFAKAFVHVLEEIGEESKKQQLNALENQNNTEPLSNEKKQAISELQGKNQMDVIRLGIEDKNYLDGDGKRIVDALFLHKNYLDPQDNSIQSNEIDYRISNIEDWFIEFQLRLDYLFKREVKWYLFIVAFILCSILNIDTINIYQSLLKDEDRRARMVIMGENFASLEYDTIKRNMDSVLTKSFEKLETQLKDNFSKPTNLDSAEVEKIVEKTKKDVHEALINTTKTITDDAYGLIGWDSEDWKTFKSWFSKESWYKVLFKILGILISAFALMFGAPFWHEYLKSMLAVRKVIQPKGFAK